MENKKYYLESDEKIKEEWINGVKYMSPRPAPNHGRIQTYISRKIGNYLENKECELFSEVDLTLSEKDKPLDIFKLKHPIIPDLFVVCNENYEEVGNNIVCIPDSVFEIVSPSSIKMDYDIKKELYLNAGVKEYWVVDYLQKQIIVWFNGEQKEYDFEEKVKVNIFDDLEIDLSKVKLSKS